MWSTARCANCQKVWDAGDLVEVRHLWERVEPGGEFPAGQCPDDNCGSLCFPVFSIETLASRVMTATVELKEEIERKFNGVPLTTTPNERRKAKAENALTTYTLNGEDQEDAITDLLTDLCHLKDPETVDRCLGKAATHYDVERECARCMGYGYDDPEVLCDQCQADHAADKQDAADNAREAAEDRAIEDEITATADHLYGPVEGGGE